jgi:AraC-like DNA-binding protein
MLPLESFLQHYTQNHKLPIRLSSPSFGHLPAEIAAHYPLVHRTPHYFLLFMVDGLTRHGADLQQFEVHNHELLFILPHQLHHLPPGKQGTDYYKLGFDESCLALLPRHYAFLLNPFNNQKVRFGPAAAARVKAIFDMLLDLLRAMDTPAELILAHLNSLLTEVNAAYFAAHKNPADGQLAHYIRFKLLVEASLAEHPSIGAMAEELALNPNRLYSIVKHYSGLSPKEFITHRLVLEAKRRLYYSPRSVKELAYELGFNDPEYFARVFKKVTGQTVSTFVQDLSGN